MALFKNVFSIVKNVGNFNGSVKKAECISTHLYSTSTSTDFTNSPLILSRKVTFENPVRKSVPAWLESLKTVESTKIGIIDLHPDIWTTYPRLDLLQKNVKWQRLFRRISLSTTKSRADRRGGGRKPWPQKGLGKARHGSIRSPIWLKGGRAHGPHGPKSFFYMLPLNQRIAGLRAALSIKFAQNDLHFVDDLDISSNDEQYLEDLADQRNWGHSVLFVDNDDEMPENIALASHEKPGFTLMPTYGLNVYSMLKHETLILTLAAVEKIESQLLVHMNNPEHRERKYHPGSGFNPSSISYDRFTT